MTLFKLESEEVSIIILLEGGITSYSQFHKLVELLSKNYYDLVCGSLFTGLDRKGRGGGGGVGN